MPVKQLAMNTDQEPLKDYQQRVVDKIQDQDGLVVAHGVGSGKTRSSIEAYKHVDRPTTVVVPASLRENYRKELKKWVGKVPDNVSIESQQRISRRGLNTKPDDFLVVDESHRARNVDTKLLHNLNETRARKRLLLTATPVYNRPSDIAPLVNFVARQPVLPQTPSGFDAKYVQRNEVDPGWLARMRGIKPGIVEQLKNKGALGEILNQYVDYQEGSDEHFPSSEEELIRVPMSDKQNEVYNGILGRLPAWAQYKIKANMPPNKQESKDLNAFLSGTRQVSNSTRGFVSNQGDVESPKIDHAVHLLQERLNENPRYKALVYSNFLQSGLADYKKRLDEAHIPYGEFTGEIDDEKRQQTIRDYNEDKLRTLLVSSAGGEGLDLKGTRLIQLLEPHFNVEKEKQIIGRGTRYMSHEHLDPNERNVRIQRFLSTVPPPKGYFKTKPATSVDEYIHTMAQRKDALNQQLMGLLEKHSEELPTPDSLYKSVIQGPRESLEKWIDALGKKSGHSVAQIKHQLAASHPDADAALQKAYDTHRTFTVTGQDGVRVGQRSSVALREHMDKLKSLAEAKTKVLSEYDSHVKGGVSDVNALGSLHQSKDPVVQQTLKELTMIKKKAPLDNRAILASGVKNLGSGAMIRQAYMNKQAFLGMGSAPQQPPMDDMQAPQQPAQKPKDWSTPLLLGGTALTGLGASLFPATRPMTKILYNYMTNKNNLARTRTGTPQYNATFIRNYLETATRGFDHPLTKPIASTFHKMNTGKPLSLVEKLYKNTIMKAYFGKKMDDRFTRDHYLRFSAGPRSGLDHWTYELGSHNDYYMNQIKDRLRAAHPGEDIDALVQQAYKNKTVYKGLDGGTATTSGKKIDGDISKIMDEGTAHGNVRNEMLDEYNKHLYQGANEYDATEMLGSTNNPRVKELLKRLAFNKMQAALKTYGPITQINNGILATGTGALATGGAMKYMDHRKQLQDDAREQAIREHQLR